MGIGRPSLVGYQTISGRLHLVKALVSSIITATIWFFFFLFCLVQSPHVKSSMLLGSIRSMWRAMTSPAFDFQGDPAQQGGTLILGPGNEVHFLHHDRNRLDHVPINSVLQLAGVKTVNFTNKPQIIDVWHWDSVSFLLLLFSTRTTLQWILDSFSTLHLYRTSETVSGIPEHRINYLALKTDTKILFPLCIR